MKNKINFIIPDFLNVDESVYLLDTFKSHKEIFKDGINILGLTGQFNGCVWNEKNKKFDMYRLSLEILQGIKNKYKSLNVSLIIIFDKEEVSVKDIEDEYSNKVMEIFNDKNNYVLCKSNRLKEYIKENYKEVKVIDYYKGNNTNDDYLIVDPELNRDDSLFNLDYKNKLIMMPDLGFIPNKKWLFKHSKKDSVLNKINPKKDKYYSKVSSKSFYEIKQERNYLTYEDLVECSKKGINTFMLSGLGVYNVGMYENLISYLINEEYSTDIRKTIYFKIVESRIFEEKDIFEYKI